MSPSIKSLCENISSVGIKKTISNDFNCKFRCYSCEQNLINDPYQLISPLDSRIYHKKVYQIWGFGNCSRTNLCEECLKKYGVYDKVKEILNGTYTDELFYGENHG